jgi:hypothetical protein
VADAALRLENLLAGSGIGGGSGVSRSSRRVPRVVSWEISIQFAGRLLSKPTAPFFTRRIVVLPDLS